jgi:Cu2+-containing amine oxidase
MLDINYFAQGYLGQIQGSICIWEQPDNTPIMRHYDLEGTFATSVPSPVLVVRAAATEYNYDYIFSYVFHADGSIKVEMAASGYLQSELRAFSAADKMKEKQFQRAVNTFSAGNIHDHLYGFKVDLDVLGVKNSLIRSEVKTGTYKLPWNMDGKVERMKYINQFRVEKEGKDGTYVSDPRKPTTLMFVKEGETNEWGSTRGYGIQLGHTIAQLVDKAPWLPSSEWTKYNIAVTNRKDSEMKSGYPLYDMQAPANPIFTFDSFMNGESLVDTDLVAWVTVGNIHIPCSEDAPVTTTAHTSLEFIIRPMNYFDESPVTDLTTRVFVTGPAPLDTPETIDTVNTPIADRCYDGIDTPVYEGWDW